MPINCYDTGDVIHLTAAFADSNLSPIAPSVVTFKINGPGFERLYTYGVDSQLISNGTGNYFIDIEVTVSGKHYYRWQSTGTGQAVEEGEFYVRESRIF